MPGVAAQISSKQTTRAHPQGLPVGDAQLIVSSAYRAAHDTDSPSVLATARALVEHLRIDMARYGDATCLPAETVALMRKAGLFRLLQPARYGGAQSDPATFFTVQAILSEGDMSAGWLQGVMGVLAFHLALFDVRAQDEVWGENPNALLSSSYMPTGKALPVNGGFRLSGRWGFASGSDYCDWLMLGGIVADDGQRPDLRVFLVPRAAATIHRSWDTTGLRATGSHDVSVETVFVPDYRTHRHVDRFHGLSAGLSVNMEPVYRIPLPQLLFRAVSTPAIGALAGFLDLFIAHSRERIAVTGQSVARDPVVQQACGETAAAIDEMLAMQVRNFHVLLDRAKAGEDASLHERSLYRLQATMVSERCQTLAARLFKVSGASALNRKLPFARLLADIQAARQHAANQYEGHGRMLGGAMLGLEAEDMLL